MKLQYNVPQQVPEYVRAEHPAFVEFLQAYYKWYETEFFPHKIEDIVDVNSTVDEYIRYFKSTLDVNGVLHNTDSRVLLRNLKQLYNSKGSETGFDFFFKAVFNTSSASVSYPWDYVFRPSDGQWVQDTAVLITMVTGTIDQLAGNQVHVVDVTGTMHTTFIKSYTQKTDDVYEVFITRFTYEPNTFVRIESLDGTVTATLQKTTTKAIIDRGGKNFSVGQVFQIQSSTTQQASIKVLTTYENGGLETIEITNGGSGFYVGQRITVNSYSGTSATLSITAITLTGGIGNCTIARPGQGFVADQIFDIEPNKQPKSFLKVKSVSSQGSITAVQLISFGVGYDTDFNVLLSPKAVYAPVVLPMFSVLSTPSGDSVEYITDDTFSPHKEDGIIVRHDYTQLISDGIIAAGSFVVGKMYKIVSVGSTDFTLIGAADNNVGTTFIATGVGTGDGTASDQTYLADGGYVGEVVAVIRNQNNFVPVPGNEDYAHIRLNTGYIYQYPGYYASSQNILGDLVYIQDSNYYQVYSYVISVEQTLDKYGSALKSVLHPAGTKQFGNYLVNNTFNITPVANISVGTISREDSYRDTVFMIDVDAPTFTVYKNVVDTAVTSEHYTFNVIKSLADTITLSEDVTKAVSKQLNDLVTTFDTIDILPIRGFFDTVGTSETIAFQTDKYLADDAQTSNAGVIALPPFYTDLPDQVYWLGGYLENEYAITN